MIAHPQSLHEYSRPRIVRNPNAKLWKIYRRFIACAHRCGWEEKRDDEAGKRERERENVAQSRIIYELFTRRSRAVWFWRQQNQKKEKNWNKKHRKNKWKRKKIVDDSFLSSAYERAKISLWRRRVLFLFSVFLYTARWNLFSQVLLLKTFAPNSYVKVDIFVCSLLFSSPFYTVINM